MGPCCSILLNRKFDFEEIYELDLLLEKIALNDIKYTTSTRDFCIDSNKLLQLKSEGSNCLFTIQFKNKFKRYEKEEIDEINSITGKEFLSEISICASCNQNGDHNILAELALEFLKIFGGMINYGGNLNIFHKGITQELKGNIISIPINAGFSENHLSDKEFLFNWINHRNFRMIK